MSIDIEDYRIELFSETMKEIEDHYQDDTITREGFITCIMIREIKRIVNDNSCDSWQYFLDLEKDIKIFLDKYYPEMK